MLIDWIYSTALRTAALPCRLPLVVCQAIDRGVVIGSGACQFGSHGLIVIGPEAMFHYCHF